MKFSLLTQGISNNCCQIFYDYSGLTMKSFNRAIASSGAKSRGAARLTPIAYNKAML